MMYLLDTSAFSDLMRARPGIEGHLRSLSPADRVVVCPVVRGEIAYGIGRMPDGARKAALLSAATALLARFVCEPIPAGAAEHYARMKLMCQRAGVSLDENDFWIAATAMSIGAHLVTRDYDFRRIDGLPVVDWSM